ncbi:hypothetical protein C1H76_6335 [Elsinoe australis]|uniref:Uncharacterized protein n=1 Tax=Elsinoe australis TaxID=40998 RepID=A0A4U7AWV3_9PEZI|nr:hypothetical protein C1H76_6335 [Elsinoe australis]
MTSKKESSPERKISLGRGGAGNLRRPSDIVAAAATVEEDKQGRTKPFNHFPSPWKLTKQEQPGLETPFSCLSDKPIRNSQQ